jgi:hypothetical protein
MVLKNKGTFLFFKIINGYIANISAAHPAPRLALSFQKTGEIFRGGKLKLSLYFRSTKKNLSLILVALDIPIALT